MRGRCGWRGGDGTATVVADTPRAFVVVEGPAGCSEADIVRARAAGHRLVQGFRPAAHATGAVRIGVVDGPDSAAVALLAALDGAPLILEVRADAAVVDRLVDDLRRLGRVEHRVAAANASPVLTADARAILGLLAEGHSLGEAAGIVGLPRRTADRRLAAARAALGVERTTEAIARARHLGWVGAAGRDG